MLITQFGEYCIAGGPRVKYHKATNTFTSQIQHSIYSYVGISNNVTTERQKAGIHEHQSSDPDPGAKDTQRTKQSR
jgi:hypothetical protein